MYNQFLIISIALSVCCSNALYQMDWYGGYPQGKFHGYGSNNQTGENNRNEQVPYGVSGRIDVNNEYGPGSDYGYGDIDLMTYNNYNSYIDPNAYKSYVKMPSGLRYDNINLLMKPYNHRYEGFDSNKRPSNQRDEFLMMPSTENDYSLMKPSNSKIDGSSDMPCTFRISCVTNEDDSNTMPSSERDGSDTMPSSEIDDSLIKQSNCFIDGSGDLQCTFRISGASKDVILRKNKHKKSDKKHHKTFKTSHERFRNSHKRFKNSRERFRNSHERFRNSHKRFKNSREQFKNSREKFRNSHERFKIDFDK